MSLTVALMVGVGVRDRGGGLRGHSCYGRLCGVELDRILRGGRDVARLILVLDVDGPVPVGIPEGPTLGGSIRLPRRPTATVVHKAHRAYPARRGGVGGREGESDRGTPRVRIAAFDIHGAAWGRRVDRPPALDRGGVLVAEGVAGSGPQDVARLSRLDFLIERQAHTLELRFQPFELRRSISHIL